MTSAQTIPCENSHIINDDPITEGLYQASDYILSTGKVHSMSTVGFGSFGYTLLEEGFEVELQATFIASMISMFTVSLEPQTPEGSTIS